MGPVRPGFLSRRLFLASVPLTALAEESRKGVSLASQAQRYLDPATEFSVLRLTSPEHSSFLPAPPLEALPRRGSFLLFASNRGGTLQAYRMDLKTGEWRQITEAARLDRGSLTLVGEGRSICYFDGAWLRVASLDGTRERRVYQVPDGWERAPGFSVSIDGLHAAWVERKGDTHRLRLARLATGAATTVVESEEALEWPAIRPRRAGILYRQRDSLALVDFDGRNNRRLKTAPGAAGQALWSPDGKTVLYLLVPEDKKAHQLREITPDTNAEALVGPTTQFTRFHRNGDASVFVGASSSKAAPYVLLLLRVTRREFTLCEHQSSDPGHVSLTFSPTSDRIFFESDRHGKPAIYTMNIERLVEKTES